MEKKGYIFDIQSFSVHDGPGCRTDIFLTGCPLQCRWCANPESWKRHQHLMFAKRVCKWEQGCRACLDICPKHAISQDESGVSVDWTVCGSCTTFECTEICPNEALKKCVREYTVEDIIKILKRDCSKWGAEGGVTFTGGDPLTQSSFLLDVLKECRKMQIHTAVETSACFPEETFLEIMDYVQFAFIDVKNMDREKHKEGTGVYNDQILSNIHALMKSGWKGRLVLRYPVIEGYNDSEENALKLIDFMNENNLFEVNLLRFHRLGETKWNQLGKEYDYSSKGNVTEEWMYHLQDIYLDHDIACYVGDDTPF